MFRSEQTFWSAKNQKGDCYVTDGVYWLKGKLYFSNTSSRKSMQQEQQKVFSKDFTKCRKLADLFSG